MKGRREGGVVERGSWRYGAVVLVVTVIVVGVLAVPTTAGSRPGSATVSARAVPAGTCQEVAYATLTLAVSTSSCAMVYMVEFGQNLSTWNATNQWNFSFSINAIAEVTPGGQIVRIASPLWPFQGSANITFRGSEVDLFTSETMNVTNASGSWTPNDTWIGPGPQWKISNVSVGITTADVTFHMLLAGNSSNGTAAVPGNSTDRVKFDMSITGWPWLSASDSLGFELASLGAMGSHFSYDPSARALNESWDSNDSTLVSLVFGPTANTSAPVGPTEATVGVEVGLFAEPTQARQSVALVTFEGVAGNYTAVTYDPWVVFLPSGFSTTPPPPLKAAGSLAWVPVSVGIVAAAAGLVSLGAFVLRTSRLQREGAALVRGMRSVISNDALGPKRPR